MLKLILAYILGIAMSFGAAELPATPDIMEEITIENVVIRVDETEYALDSRAVFGAAAGTEEVLLKFFLENGGSRLFPIDAKITAEELMFAISEAGSTFRITDAAINDMLGVPEGFFPEEGGDIDDVNLVINGVQFTGGAVEFTPEEEEAAANAAQEFLAAHADAEVRAGSIRMDGVDYPGRTIAIENCVPALMDLADHFARNDFGAVSEEFKSLMEEYNYMLDEDITSFREMFTFEEEIPNIRMEYTSADVQGEDALKIEMTMNEDGFAMDVVGERYKGSERAVCKFAVAEDGYATEIQLNLEVEEPEDGESIAAVLDISFLDAYEVMDNDTVYTKICVNAEMQGDNDTADMRIYGDYAEMMRYGDGSVRYGMTETMELGVALSERDEKLHIQADFTADFEESDLDLGLEMDLAYRQAPCEDTLQGRNIVDFTSEQELMESGQFIGDAMAFSLDSMRLTMTQDAGRILKMVDQLMETPVVGAEEYAAMGAEFGASLPEFRLPENWHVQDVDIYGDMLTVYCASGGEGFRATLTRSEETGSRVEYLMLNEEGKLVPAGGSVIEYAYDNNGNVLGAMLLRNGLAVEFDFDYVDAAFAEEVIDGLVWAE